MRHVRMLGLCLVAALALGAYAVSSASALEWGKCESVGSGGNYTGPNCTKAEKAKPKGTGSYEWRKASEVAAKREAEGKSANVKFTGNNVGNGGVLTVRPRWCEGPSGGITTVTRAWCAEQGDEAKLSEQVLRIECESESNHGETEGKNKVANVAVKFKGCVIFGSAPCSNGTEEGEINTATLAGKLGYLSKSEHKAGLVLEPSKHHGDFASFVCAGVLGTVVGAGNKKEGAEYTSSGCSGICAGATPEEEKHGGYDQIISPITPANEMTSHFTQVFTVNPETSANIPSSLEGKHISLLESYTYATENPANGWEWSAAGEEITNENTSEEEGEIKA